MSRAARSSSELRQPTARGSQAGFTLLEVIIALTIMALMTLVLYFSFRLAMNSYQKGQDRIAEEAYSRALEDQIKRQIGSLYPLRPAISLANIQQQQAMNPDQDVIAASQVPLFYGSSQSVTFITIAPLMLLEHPGLTVVRYGLAQDERGRHYLGALEGRYLGLESFNAMIQSTQEKPLPLVQNVEQLTFEYYGYDPQSQTYNWYESWDAQQTGSVPQAIRIQADKKIIVVPINATFNNQAQTQMGGGF